jgi:hypothetical protein
MSNDPGPTPPQRPGVDLSGQVGQNEPDIPAGEGKYEQSEPLQLRKVSSSVPRDNTQTTHENGEYKRLITWEDVDAWEAEQQRIRKLSKSLGN